MLFSVIYSADCDPALSIRQYSPANLKQWDLTERADGEPDEWCGEWWGGKCKHRKWCAVLTRPQFEAFLNKACIYPSDTETMGSLGAPGLGHGVSPAICFDDFRDDAILNAYVTPIPQVERKRDLTPEEEERVWQRLRHAVIRQYQ